MAKRKTRQREAGREIGAAIAAYMDALEEKSWAQRDDPNHVRVDIVSTVDDLLEIVHQHLPTVKRAMAVPWMEALDYVMPSLEGWTESRAERFGEDSDRAIAAWGLFAGLGLGGIGNLFGLIPADAPAFDPELAQVGVARGWRRRPSC